MANRHRGIGQGLSESHRRPHPGHHPAGQRLGDFRSGEGDSQLGALGVEDQEATGIDHRQPGTRAILVVGEPRSPRFGRQPGQVIGQDQRVPLHPQTQIGHLGVSK